MRKSDKQSLKIAMGGIIAALSTVIMLLSNVITIGTYALPALAGLVITVVVVEVGKRWALAVYIVVCLLSFVLVADKETVLIFSMFLGYYPILKALLESKKNRIFQIIMKLLVFNITMIAVFLLSINIFSIPIEEFYIGEVNISWLLLLVGNVIFVIYDYTLTLLITTYIRRLRGRIFKHKL